MKANPNASAGRSRAGDSKVVQMVMTAMVVCMIILMIFLIRIPIPFTQGYLNLGDGIIFIGVFLLGKKNGAIAAALGGMLGDVLGGFAMWAPWTLCIKGIMALVCGLLCEILMKTKFAGKNKWTARTIAMVIAGLFMVFGYFIGEGVMYGNWAIAALGVPWNIGQFAVGIVLAVAVTIALEKTPLANNRNFALAKTREHSIGELNEETN